MANNIDLLKITTPLGEGAFVIAGIAGHAALSQCFSYSLRLQAGSKALDANQLLDKAVTVTISEEGANQTFVNGVVCTVLQKPGNVVGSGGGAGLEAWDYELTIVPWLWFLNQTSDCRIFQNMTGTDIVQKIFNEFGYSDFTVNATPTTTYEYTVMYNESYLAFVQRILARDGLCYYFTHESDKHVMQISDNLASGPSLGTVKFAGQTATEVGVHTLQRGDSTAVGRFVGNDYNYTMASTSLQGQADTVLKASKAKTREFYRFPAEYPKKDNVDKQVRWQNEAAEVRAQLFSGGGNAPQMFAPGFLVTIEGDPFTKSDYIIAAASIGVTDHAGISGGQASIDVSFTLFEKSTAWRPELLSKPLVPGLQSAIVVGKSGEELWTDKHGRVKVQFNWDTRGKKDENSSCWLRVIQPWAGNGWGFQFLPRIGQEAAVTFLEGDIDRPVVIGSFYNSDQPTLFSLPSEQNKSGIRSRSTKGGGASNYSEFSIDDTKGSEVVLLHAEKDYTIEVEHDETRTIGNDRTVTVKKNETITVDGDQKETVKGNRTFEVKGNHSETVDGNQTVTVKGNQDQTVKGNQTHTVKGNQSEKVNGEQSISVMQAVTYESMSSITLKVGGNSIKIDQTGITMSGIIIKVTADGELKTSGAIAQHSGEGVLKLQGGIIMVN